VFAFVCSEFAGGVAQPGPCVLNDSNSVSPTNGSFEELHSTKMSLVACVSASGTIHATNGVP
jgi:hypothetical protein